MPAVMAAVISIIFCAINPTPYVNDEAEQGWLTQLYCLLCTLGCAIVGGLSKFRGVIINLPTKNDEIVTIPQSFFSYWWYPQNPINRIC